jgi:hypothetical protein
MLRSRLKLLMQADPNAGESGDYLIRCLYFDDFWDSSLYEKLAEQQKRMIKWTKGSRMWKKYKSQNSMF